MRTFKRRGAAFAMVAAFSTAAALFAAPVASAATNPTTHSAVAPVKGNVSHPTYGIGCAVLDAQLTTELNAAAAALAATPPNVAAAQAQVAAAQATLIQLQTQGCLRSSVPAQSCAALLTQLRTDAQALVNAINATPQNPTAIVAALEAIEYDIRELAEQGCLDLR